MQKIVDTEKKLGLNGNIHERIKDATFVGAGDLWKKDHLLPEPKLGPQIHVYSFHKFGKTLGMQTKRFL